MRSAWFVAGAAAGAYGMVKARRLAEALTPDGMRDRVGAAFVGARIFRDEVAQGQADAETKLRHWYRDAQAGPPALESSTSSGAPEELPKGHELP